MHSLNVAMVSTYFYPKIGGSEKQLLTLGKTLCTRGHTVMIVTQRYNTSLLAYETIYGMHIYRLPTIGVGISASFSFMVSLLYFMIIKRNHYDVIHVNLASSPALSAAFVGRVLKKRVIIKPGGGSIHGDIATSKNSLLGRMKLGLLRRSKALFVGVSKEIIDELVENLFDAKNIHYIPNGVDTQIYIPVDTSLKNKLRKELNIPDHARVFIFSGRLVRLKNIDRLLQSWRMCEPHRYNMYLLIIGEGSEEKHLRDSINKWNHQRTISIRPFQKDIHLYYQASDVLVCISESEGLSNTLLEGMACGLPVIGSLVRSVQEIVTHRKEGLLVDHTNNKNICEALLFFAQHSDIGLQMGINAHKKIEQDFSISRVSLQYESLYTFSHR